MDDREGGRSPATEGSSSGPLTMISLSRRATILPLRSTATWGRRKYGGVMRDRSEGVCAERGCNERVCEGRRCDERA